MFCTINVKKVKYFNYLFFKIKNKTLISSNISFVKYCYLGNDLLQFESLLWLIVLFKIAVGAYSFINQSFEFYIRKFFGYSTFHFDLLRLYYIQKLNITYCRTFVEAKYSQTFLWSTIINTCRLNSVITKFVNYVLYSI